MPRIRSNDREVVEYFIKSGVRLTGRLKTLLKACEKPMLKAGKGHAGIEFVESIFGRDQQLENTEKLIISIRLWKLRFDANCEDVLCPRYTRSVD